MTRKGKSGILKRHRGKHSYMETVNKIVAIALAACCLVPMYTVWCVYRAGGDGVGPGSIISPSDLFFVWALAICGALTIGVLILG